MLSKWANKIFSAYLNACEGKTDIGILMQFWKSEEKNSGFQAARHMKPASELSSLQP